MTNKKPRQLVKFMNYVKTLPPIELIGLCTLLKIDMLDFAASCGKDLDHMNDEDYLLLYVEIEKRFSALNDSLRKKLFWIIKAAAR